MTENKVVNSNEDENSISFRLYNILIVIIDLIVTIVKMFYFDFEAIYQTIFPTEKVSVDNKVVLVTGAAHGIGKEIALKYASLGARVVCWDINEKGNADLVEEIKSRGGKSYAYVCNVLSRENILEVAENVKKEVGSVDIIVNNAGIMPCHPFLEHTVTEIENMFNINVMAHFWILQAFLPDMIEKKSGHIVALSSCAGLFGLTNLVPYCGTKFAVRGIMQSLHEELRVDSRNLDIKFTTVYPYMVDTGLCKKPHMRFPALMRLMKPEEVAEILVDAQRSGVEEVTTPKYFLYVEKMFRLFPKKAVRVLNDFLDVGVHSDK